MPIVCSGLSFKDASIEMQERLSVAIDDAREAMRSFVQSPCIMGAYVLSTCNRMEVYLDAADEQAALDVVRSFVGERLDEPSLELRELRERSAIEHLVRVACSLESRIIGESQILGQVKKALEAAQAAGALTEDLSKLVKCAISAGKRVRAETAISEGSVSLSSVALQAAERRLGGLGGRSALLIGSGEMARIAAQYLAERPLSSVDVCSRTASHAQDLAEAHGMGTVMYEDRVRCAARSDLVFVAVRTDETVLLADDLVASRRESGRSHVPLVIVDEGMPRNVDPLCRYVDDVELIDLHTLNSELDDAFRHRREAAVEAWDIVDETVEGYCAWLQERYVTPTIKEISQAADASVLRESERARKALENELGRELNDREASILASYGSAVKKRMLHDPITRLRRQAHSPQSSDLTFAARYLFGLEGGE